MFCIKSMLGCMFCGIYMVEYYVLWIELWKLYFYFCSSAMSMRIIVDTI